MFNGLIVGEGRTTEPVPDAALGGAKPPPSSSLPYSRSCRFNYFAILKPLPVFPFYHIAALPVLPFYLFLPF